AAGSRARPRRRPSARPPPRANHVLDSPPGLGPPDPRVAIGDGSKAAWRFSRAAPGPAGRRARIDHMTGPEQLPSLPDLVLPQLADEARALRSEERRVGKGASARRPRRRREDSNR